ncbi:MAG: leucine-rich repeat protein, partial [Lachnospiraceae bacterium]|nr:leucine-rich repeat protein [Lachnospiraceae bacterium]
PTTEQAKDFGNGEDDDLKEFDYSSQSGWMYAVNNVLPGNIPINGYILKDGDVIRIQFSLTYGTDLSGFNYGTNVALCNVSNKDEALKEIGRINSSVYKRELLENETISEKYGRLSTMVQDAVIPQETLDQTLCELKELADPWLAGKVTEQIDKLNDNVDLTQLKEVEQIKDSFERLGDAQQYVPDDMKEKLEKAIKKIQLLKDQEAADKVTSQINELGKVKIDLSKENQVKEVRAAYERLTTKQKEYVTEATLKILTNAEQTIKNLKVAQPSAPVVVAPSIKAGMTVKSSSGKENVKVLSAAKRTVEYVKPSKKTYKSVTVPSTVKISGKTYKVSRISSGAFKGMTKLQKVTIGSNVEKIGSKAFYKCKKLKKITILSKKLSKSKVGSKAFYGTKKKAVVKVPKSKYKAYKKFLSKKGNKTIKVTK